MITEIGSLRMLCTTFFIFYVIAGTQSQSIKQNEIKINISLDDLKEKCESRVVNITQVLKNLNNEFNRQLTKASKKLWDLRVLHDINSWEEISSSHVLKSQCFEKSNFKQIFKNLIDTLQLCIDDYLLLKEEEKDYLSTSAVSQICSYLELGSLIKITDPDCVEMISKNINCFPLINNMTLNVDHSDFNIFLNLKHNYIDKDCKAFLKMYGCQEDVIKWCKNSTIKMHESWIKNRKSFIGCQNANNTEKKSAILDIEKGRFNFTIPELLKICESKGIDLKAKTQHANIHVFDLFLSCNAKKNFKSVETFPSEVINCIKTHCYKNYTLQSSFEKIIDSIQNCFDDASEISLNAKRNLSQTAVEAFCDKMLMGELALKDPAGTFKSLENCYEKLERPEAEVSKFFVLLSVPHVYTPKQCNYYAGLFVCAQNEFTNSSNETKAAIEAVRLRLKNC